MIGEGSPRLPTIGAVALPGASSASLLVQFDLAGIAVSAGSACSSGKMKDSAVLAAMGVAPDDRRRLPPRSASGRRPARPMSTPSSLNGGGSRRAAGGMIYLDYQATTPLAPEVAAAMRPWIEEKFANPHRPSRWGREARRRSRSRATGSSRRSVWQAGASPSPAARPKRSTGRSRDIRTVRAAQAGHRGDRACSGSRHRRMARRRRASRSCACRWPRRTARPRNPRGAIDDGTALVAVMLVNNEIGVIQPVAEIARHGAAGRGA